MQRKSHYLDNLHDVSLAVVNKYRPPLPSVLYHYTTDEGLLSIVPSNKIWSTDVRYFNDWTEINYALHTIADIFLNKMDMDPHEPSTQFIFDAIGPITIIKYENLRSGFRFHATCFSTEDDDLYQWRAYSRATEGYAIGFRAEDLHDFDICNVVYEEGHQEEIVKELISLWIQLLQQPIGKRFLTDSDNKKETYQLMQSVICRLALQFKDRRFAAEREWRIIGNMLGKDAMYRIGRIGLIPYVSLDMCSVNSSKMPIVFITQGPRLQPELEAEALAGFLSQYGYNEVEIRMSQVPIRF